MLVLLVVLLYDVPHPFTSPFKSSADCCCSLVGALVFFSSLFLFASCPHAIRNLAPELVEVVRVDVDEDGGVSVAQELKERSDHRPSGSSWNCAAEGGNGVVTTLMKEKVVETAILWRRYCENPWLD